MLLNDRAGEHRAALDAGTDAERKGTERTVRTGMRIAANERHARLNPTALGNHNVTDAVIADVVKRTRRGALAHLRSACPWMAVSVSFAGEI